MHNSNNKKRNPDKKCLFHLARRFQNAYRDLFTYMSEDRNLT